jgi:hypothetical protein
MRSTIIPDTNHGNPAAAVRLPNPDPLTMAYAARRIATRYNVGLPLARIVAELIGASLEARQ